MTLPDRKTADTIINIACGIFIGVGVAVAIIAAIFGVPVILSVIGGTILVLAWLGTLFLWAAT